MSKIAVIIGRFQDYKIHAGYEDFFTSVYENYGYDRLLVFIGVSPIGLTKKNPLDFQQREVMLREFLESACDTHFTILPVSDNASDLNWSKNLDKLIASATGFGDKITLYGSRDSFLDHYSGRYDKVNVKSNVDYSATQDREWVLNNPNASHDFRAGIIYATQKTFNHARAVVDIAVVNHIEKSLLMAKKEGEVEWRLIGGFVDTEDKTMEQTVRRELREETGLTVETKPIFLDSFRIEGDWRFRGITEYSLMSSLFLVDYAFGLPIASDDIVEVKWIKLDEVLAKTNPIHKPLVSRVLGYLYDRKK